MSTTLPPAPHGGWPSSAEELRQALAPARLLTLVAWDVEHNAGSYATVEHANGARWVLAVSQATIDAGAPAVAHAIRNTVAHALLLDAADLVSPAVRVVARGWNEYRKPDQRRV